MTNAAATCSACSVPVRPPSIVELSREATLEGFGGKPLRRPQPRTVRLRVDDPAAVRRKAREIQAVNRQLKMTKPLRKHIHTAAAAIVASVYVERPASSTTDASGMTSYSPEIRHEPPFQLLTIRGVLPRGRMSPSSFARIYSRELRARRRGTIPCEGRAEHEALLATHERAAEAWDDRQRDLARQARRRVSVA